MPRVRSAKVACEEHDRAEPEAALAGRVGRARPSDGGLRKQIRVPALQGVATKGPQTGRCGPELETDGPADGEVVVNEMHHGDTSSGQGRATVARRSVSTLA